MDSVITSLNTKLRTLKSTNNDIIVQEKSASNIKDTLKKFSGGVTEKQVAQKSNYDEKSNEDIQIVNGKEEFSIRFDANESFPTGFDGKLNEKNEQVLKRNENNEVQKPKRNQSEDIAQKIKNKLK